MKPCKNSHSNLKMSWISRQFCKYTHPLKNRFTNICHSPMPEARSLFSDWVVIILLAAVEQNILHRLLNNESFEHICVCVYVWNSVSFWVFPACVIILSSFQSPQQLLGRLLYASVRFGSAPNEHHQLRVWLQCRDVVCRNSPNTGQ